MVFKDVLMLDVEKKPGGKFWSRIGYHYFRGNGYF